MRLMTMVRSSLYAFSRLSSAMCVCVCVCVCACVGVGACDCVYACTFMRSCVVCVHIYMSLRVCAR
jgi:hypothetical protein